MSMAELAQQEIETAPATNIRVASRVMGWTQWVNLAEDCPSEPGVTYFADWNDGCGLSVYLPDSDGDVAFYFNPAENIADAWKVVEKLEWMAPAIYRGYSFNWGCRMGDAHGEGDTAPLAICHAALEATERVGGARVKRCNFPWCGVEKLCVDCAT